MGQPHRLTERRQVIISALEEAGQLLVAELSRRFDVTDVTIRADLQALSKQGLVQRMRGWAMAMATLPEMSYDVRQQLFAAQKSRIGDFTSRLAYLEELKMMPFETVWYYHCLQNDALAGLAYLNEIKRYEAEVLSQRQ